MRLRNSGRKLFRSSIMTLSRTLSGIVSPVTPSRRKREPRFEVMMMTVFLKSTVRPCESVMRPSSKTWSSTLNTSGCAFSISSKRITA